MRGKQQARIADGSKQRKLNDHSRPDPEQALGWKGLVLAANHLARFRPTWFHQQPFPCVRAEGLGEGQLDNADASDVGQRVWLHLVSQLDTIRDPAALPGWLATTTQRECGTIRRAMRRSQSPGHVLDAGHIPDQQTGIAEHELLAAERHAALREAVTRLSPRCQRLIAVLIEDPPVPYAQISARLGIPVGSIRPSRSHCLERLRRDPAIAALINIEAGAADVNCPDRRT
jgi:RNA polymerase sigma factor (sigma-70 family)